MENTTEYICFTSAAGGAGCTGCAVAFARIMRLMFKKRVLFLSLDLLSDRMSFAHDSGFSSKRILTGMLQDSAEFIELMNNSLVEDEFHVSYLSDASFYNPLHALSSEDLGILLDRISKSGLFDFVVIDLPFRNLFAERLVYCCEKIVLVSGYLSSQIRINSMLYSHLELNIHKLVSKPDLCLFSPPDDPDSFESEDVDIHGELGSGLRALASELYQGRIRDA